MQNDASQTSNSRSNAGPPGGRYTPLSALASLQPGGAGAQTPHQGSSRFQTTSTYQHPFAPHQGDYIFYSYIKSNITVRPKWKYGKVNEPAFCR